MSARAKVDIIRRRVNIPYDSAQAPGWIPAEADIENVLNAISFVFPPGEKFFIQSVQHYHDRITDPELKEQVKAFVFQEAMHSKEHARANAKLAQSFPQGPQIEQEIIKTLAVICKYSSRKTQLAFTCALEHFTAILSHELLIWQEGFIAKSEPAFAAMWLWHAVEEAEHKAVCFDVYQTVCGKGPISYLRRVAVMAITTLLFAHAARVSVRMLRQNAKEPAPEAKPAPKAEPAAQAADAPDKARSTLQVLREIVPFKLYFDYYRPTFHPWDIDDSHLIAEWKTRYKDFGALSDAADHAHGDAHH